jgi:hypothetical protein
MIVRACIKNYCIFHILNLIIKNYANSHKSKSVTNKEKVAFKMVR